MLKEFGGIYRFFNKTNWYTQFWFIYQYMHLLSKITSTKNMIHLHQEYTLYIFDAIFLIYKMFISFISLEEKEAVYRK